jgi:AcrR family transcriptional regulator
MPTKTFFNLDQEKRDRIINAAIDEFAQKDYLHANIATIIKNSSIPRGSFYQYFNDKKDLFIYIFKMMGDLKMNYMSNTLANPEQVPFLVLFKEIYISGLKFAIDHPKLIQISTHLIATKGPIYDEIMKDGMNQSLDLFIKLIDLDKSKGRIKESVDSTTFAELVRDMTVNITINELNLETQTFNKESMLHKIDQIVHIFELGVKKGDYHV